jgi:hypothetical protein
MPLQDDVQRLERNMLQGIACLILAGSYGVIMM